MFAYIFILLLYFSNTHSLILSEPQLQIKVISNIILYFYDFGIIFHYDNSTKLTVDQILTTNVINQTYLMQNYDYFESKMTSRYEGYKILHIVMLENVSRFNTYSKLNIFSLYDVDILLFIVPFEMDTNRTYNKYCENIERAGALFILNTKNMIFYNICYYCGKLEGKLQEVIDVVDNNNSGILIGKLMKNIYKKQFMDYKKHVFTLGFTTYKPFFWCTASLEKNSTNKYKLYGTEGELLSIIHKKLNMTLKIKEFKDTGEEWLPIIINNINNNSIHWALGGISITLKRLEIVDFTSSIQKEPYAILYSMYDDPWMSWTNIIYPFQLNVWLILIIILFIISCLFVIALRYVGFSLGFVHLIQTFTRLLVEQPLSSIPESMKIRYSTTILMCTWLMLTVVITNLYKSKLTSLLITSKAKEYDSIDNLVDQGFNFFFNDEESSLLQEGLKESGDSKYKEVLKRSRDDLDMCASILHTEKRKEAIIDEETNFLIKIQDTCWDSLSIEQLENLRFIKEDLFPTEHAWPMQINVPYRNALNNVISRVHAAGLFQKWQKDYAPLFIIPKGKQKQSRNSQPIRFSLVSFIGPGFILIFGIIVAIVIFVFEIICK